MKFLKFAAIFIASVALITFAFLSIFKMTVKKPVSSDTLGQSSAVEEQQNENSTAESEAVSSEESVSSEETEKAVMGDVTVNSSASLSTERITWGPGVSFNDDNQPTACVNLQEKYGHLGAVFMVDSDKIYLTFDLGYESGFTADILDTLKENNIKATFFVTGTYAQKQEELMKRVVAEGHTVGNHSMSHPDMTQISADEAVKEIMGVHDIVKEKYGYETYLFRHPSGYFSEETLALAAQNGHHSVFWSFAYNDWNNADQPDVAASLEKTTERLHPGAVYLLHPMETNSKILNQLIQNAKAEGYSFGVL